MRLFLLHLCCWFVPAVFASGVTAQESGVPIRISKETTYITSPLRNDGTVDYVEALSRRQREGVTAENNSVVLFRRALGHRDLSEKTTDEYFRQLGIETLPMDGQYLIDLDDFLKTLDSSELPEPGIEIYRRERLIYNQHREAMSRSWTREEFPIIARWVDTNETPLNFVVEGSKRPKFFSPMLPADRSVTAALFTGWQGYRESVGVLSARAMLRLSEGNLDAAWRDVMACHRIARLLAQGPTAVDVLMAASIESIACVCDDEIAHHGNLSADQSRSNCSELQDLGVITGMADRLETSDRFLYFEVVFFVAAEGKNARNIPNFIFMEHREEEDTALAEFVRQSFTKGLVDVNIVLKIGNQWFDRLVVAGHLPTRIARQSELARLNTQLQQAIDDARTIFLNRAPVESHVVSENVGVIFLKSQIAMVVKSFEVEDRCSMCTELSCCAFALAAWKADHGDYPDQLNQLTPDYLKTIPIDNHTGQSLIYRRSDTGYRLYSLGVNLIDDDGFTRSDTNETDDIVIRTPDEDRRIKAVTEKRRSEN